jgi:hypothetical protein
MRCFVLKCPVKKASTFITGFSEKVIIDLIGLKKPFQNKVFLADLTRPL